MQIAIILLFGCWTNFNLMAPFQVDIFANGNKREALLYLANDVLKNGVLKKNINLIHTPPDKKRF